jgi:hypothetical protein
MKFASSTTKGEISQKEIVTLKQEKATLLGSSSHDDGDKERLHVRR